MNQIATTNGKTETNYEKLAKIDLNGKTEKKGKFTYLSWAYAVDELMKADPNANWEIHTPQFYGQQVMVSCTVTAFNKPIYMWLPVMDNANRAMSNPSVCEINKAQMRCLVKAIACHGLGLYIYAGEDLPIEESPQTTQTVVKQPLDDERFNNAVQAVKNGQFDKVRLLTEYQLTDQQRQIAQGL